MNIDLVLIFFQFQVVLIHEGHDDTCLVLYLKPSGKF